MTLPLIKLSQLQAAEAALISACSNHAGTKPPDWAMQLRYAIGPIVTMAQAVQAGATAGWASLGNEEITNLDDALARFDVDV